MTHILPSSIRLVSLLVGLVALLLQLPLSTFAAEIHQQDLAHGSVFSGDGVMELDKESFMAALASPQHMLVEFYAPWCGFCRRFAPTFAEFSQAAKVELPDLFVGRVNYDTNDYLGGSFMIDRLPSFAFIEKSPEGKKPLVRWLDIPKDGDSLIRFVKDGEWRQLEPAGSSIYSFYCSPLNFCGKFAGSLSEFAAFIGRHNPTPINPWILLSILVTVAFFPCHAFIRNLGRRSALWLTEPKTSLEARKKTN